MDKSDEQQIGCSECNFTGVATDGENECESCYVERWMVDYEHGEGGPQHTVLSWLDDEASELPEVGEYLIRESDARRFVLSRLSEPGEVERIAKAIQRLGLSGLGADRTYKGLLAIYFYDSEGETTEAHGGFDTPEAAMKGKWEIRARAALRALVNTGK